MKKMKRQTSASLDDGVVARLCARRPSASSLFRASPRRSNPSRARTARTATPSRVVLAPRVVRDVSIPIGGTNPKRTNVARRRLAASRRQRRRRASTGASQASRAVRLVRRRRVGRGRAGAGDERRRRAPDATRTPPGDAQTPAVVGEGTRAGICGSTAARGSGGG